MKKEQTGMKEANRTCKMKNIVPEIENLQDKFNSTAHQAYLKKICKLEERSEDIIQNAATEDKGNLKIICYLKTIAYNFPELR